ncbi:MAG: hypothetical protein R3F50_15235 [Gammaproteobacteria bacterium]|jgi:hypothetical protein
MTVSSARKFANTLLAALFAFQTGRMLLGTPGLAILRIPGIASLWRTLATLHTRLFFRGPAQPFRDLCIALLTASRAASNLPLVTLAGGY